MGKVQVWASQLWANDFPPVCAMTGRPAETWKKFKFATPPTWTYVLLLLTCLGGLGIIAYGIVVWAVAQKATGYLPLTRSSSRIVAIALWGPVVAFGLFVLCWLLAAIVGLPSNDPTASTVAGILFGIGALLLFAGIVGRLILMPLICPRAKVMEQQPYQYDKLVELRNVHPLFVAAVVQRQQASASHYIAPSQSPYLPGST